jgi:hypothetical protein
LGRETPALFPVRQDEKWGYIDREGGLVVDYQYAEARDFSDGLGAVRVGESWGYVDATGALAIQPKFESGQPFNDGLAAAKIDGQMGYIDQRGEVAIEPQFTCAYEFREGLAGVETDAGYAYIDTSGEIVIRLSHAAAIGRFSEGLAGVRIGGYRYIDSTGQFVSGPEFVYATEYDNGLAVVEEQHRRYAVVNRTGQVVARVDYDQVHGLSEGLAAVLRGGLLAAVEEGRDPSESEGLWGYMDATGRLIIECHFMGAEKFRGGLARVYDENSKMAYIDFEGNYVWRER